MSAKPFVWTSRANQAFNRLKRLFTSAPILTFSDPEMPFVLEVVASDVGVGAVLSQRTRSDNKLHPCAFFSRRLTPTQRNYDNGNRELLAIKMALEEWRHWLQGAKHPFLIWTDHRNITCIWKVKRLKSQQARWALFLTDLTSLFPIAQVPRFSNQMHSRDSLSHKRGSPFQNPFSPLPG